MEPSISVVPTIVAEYEEDKVILDTLVQEDKQEEEEVELAKELEANIAGTEGYQTAILNDLYKTIGDYKGLIPNVNRYTGNEDFVETIKGWFAKIYRILKNMAVAFVEFITNRVRSLQNKYKKLDSVYKNQNLKQKGKFPASIKDLISEKISGDSVGWIFNNVTTLTSLIKGLNTAQDALEKNSLTWDLLGSAPYNFKVKAIENHNSISKALGAEGKNVPSNAVIKVNGKELRIEGGDHTSSVTMTNPLPGGKTIRLTCGLKYAKEMWSSSEEPTVSVEDVKGIESVSGKEFTPDRAVVDKTMKELGDLFKTLEKLTPSTTRVIRHFEMSVKNMETNFKSRGSIKNEENAKLLPKYFNWLIAYQRSLMSKPLAIVLNGAEAALDVTKAQLE